MIKKLKLIILRFIYKARQYKYGKVKIYNVALIFYIPKSNMSKYMFWEDGFTKGIHLLEKDYNITWINLYDKNPTVDELNKFDFILVKSCWSWIVDKYVRNLKGLKVPRGIVVSCSKKPKRLKDMFFYDVLWFETFWYEKQITEHPNTIHAFGVNSSEFYEKTIKKEIDVLGIGAITAYKRFEKIIDLPGDIKVIVGDSNMADSEKIRRKLEKNNIRIIDYISQKELALLINKSKLVCLPSEINGGGERAVLEARLCNVPVKVEDDNPKLKELLKSPIWDEFHYSKQIRHGLDNFGK